MQIHTTQTYTQKTMEPLFETKRGKGRALYRLFALSVLVGICLIWCYRVSYIPSRYENGRWVWFGLLAAELWFGLYWILTQSFRWNIVYRSTFKDRLSQRYEKDLPGVDIFVCTADPKLEPPILVINTVLSVMSYDYPPDKLSVYLSDDAGSELTYYALMEASSFIKHWIPFCKKFNIQPRSPAAYFNSISHEPLNHNSASIKKLYDEMENRIQAVTELGKVPEEIKAKHESFSQWDTYSSKQDHDTILEIVIDGKDSISTDVEGCPLPTLVYLAREKRPQHFHNFKAGAMNALIRVSSMISNGPVLLNVDCDMYSNNSQSIRDALCFFMDEEKGHEIAFVQFPQTFENITKNDLYGNSLRVIADVEFHGMDGLGGTLYIGTGCFHRRETLLGREFSKENKIELKTENITTRNQNAAELKLLASSDYEKKTKWGIEMGLRYGCPVEDVITGLSIQSKGWKSVYFNSGRTGFIGVGSTTLSQTLVQHKRWSEGDFMILFSKYSPAWYATGKINFGLQLGYCCYCLWAVNCLATLYYSIMPSICLLYNIPVFPKFTSPWFAPFAYVVFAKYTYSLIEFLSTGGTILGWWNEQRIWLYKRTSSYLFAFVDTILQSLGFSESGFVISAKVTDEDVAKRYAKEIMEFGDESLMFLILTTLALLNLLSLIGVVLKNVVMSWDIVGVFDRMLLQMVLCSVLVVVNWPIYQGLFFRKDGGKMPGSLMVKSLVLALSACTCFMFLY